MTGFRHNGAECGRQAGVVSIGSWS
jgi:hypothetical protein